VRPGILFNTDDAKNGSSQIDHVCRLSRNDELLAEIIEDDQQDRRSEAQDPHELSAHRISTNLDNAGDAKNGSNQFDHVWRLIGNDEILPETIEDDLQDRPNEVEEDG
jgi:hypothetical protein